MEKLFTPVMEGKWQVVLNTIYKERKEVHETIITKSKDTVLHVAVTDGQEEIVKQLVNIFSEKGGLRMKNDSGNTPLHNAAAVGDERMCHYIANVDPSLVDIRNEEGETPLFLAALHGNKNAFLRLHAFCEKNPSLNNADGKGKNALLNDADGKGKNADGKCNQSLAKIYNNCRRKDGETILHCAIHAENFDLAYQIIFLYDILVNSKNMKGYSPLQYLAIKPTVFRSGSHFRFWQTIIYKCTFVDKLKKTEVPDINFSPEKRLNDKKEELNCPENYRTILNLYDLLKSVVPRVISNSRDQPTAKDDVEKQGSQRKKLLPESYNTFFDYVMLVSKAMLIILGLGSKDIIKMRRKKESHTWSLQIMDELLQRTRDYEYDSTGGNPGQPEDVEITSPFNINPADLMTGVGVPGQEINKERKQNTTDQKGKETQEDGTLKVSSNGGMTEEILQSIFSTIMEVEKKKQNVYQPSIEKKNFQNKGQQPDETILLAAKNGVTEMVDKMLQLFPVAIHDMNPEKKNIVLLAAENRQPHVYKLLMERNILKDRFWNVDHEGNSALHLAAKLSDYKPWLIPGAALQMQWELKWYEFVKDSMPTHLFVRYNKKGKSPSDIFNETHEELVKSSGEWLTKTSESCSLVAALIATVAFATSSTVPGGNDQSKGTPVLENRPAFNIFAISSLVALGFSITALVMFLAILTSRYQKKDFRTSLPIKLLVGLTSLFMSIAAMLLSFCAGHFFMLKEKLKYAAFPIYAITCLPVTFFALAQLPLYLDLLKAISKEVPSRSYKVVTT